MEKFGVSIVVLGYLVFLIGCTVFIGEWWTDYRSKRRTVWHNLDEAYANGQFNRSDPENTGYLYGMTSADIAYDLTCYAEDCEDAKPWQLEPHVRSWMKQKGLK